MTTPTRTPVRRAAIVGLLLIATALAVTQWPAITNMAAPHNVRHGSTPQPIPSATSVIHTGTNPAKPDSPREVTLNAKWRDPAKGVHLRATADGVVVYDGWNHNRRGNWNRTVTTIGGEVSLTVTPQGFTLAQGFTKCTITGPNMESVESQTKTPNDTADCLLKAAA